MAVATQAEIDALETALRRGVRKVSYDNQEVEYRSEVEMRRILSGMKAEVAAAAGTSRDGGNGSGIAYPTFEKGI